MRDRDRVLVRGEKRGIVTHCHFDGELFSVMINSAGDGAFIKVLPSAIQEEGDADGQTWVRKTEVWIQGVYEEERQRLGELLSITAHGVMDMDGSVGNTIINVNKEDVKVVV